MRFNVIPVFLITMIDKIKSLFFFLFFNNLRTYQGTVIEMIIFSMIVSLLSFVHYAVYACLKKNIAFIHIYSHTF